MGAVAVQIDVGVEISEPVAAVAVQSCEAALGAGRCTLSGDNDAADAEWYAVVRWQGQRLEIARIDFRRRHAHGPLLRSRQIIFSSHDDGRDRWASVGVLVAALVASQEQRNEAAASTPSRAPDSTADTSPTSRSAEPTDGGDPRWRLDLFAVAARALDQGAMQPGAGARASLALGTMPIFISGAVSYAWRPSTQPSVSWFSESFGFGVRILGIEDGVAAELRSELVVQQWRIAATDAERSESEWLVRFGAGIGVDTLWRVGSGIALLFGGQANVLRPHVAIDVGGEPVERVPGYALLLVAGCRLLL